MNSWFSMSDVGSSRMRLCLKLDVLILPPALEPGRCQLAIPDGVLDVLVPEVCLQAARIVALVRELVAAGMAEHMGMHFDLEPGRLASPANELLKVADGHWRAALGHEQEGRSAFSLTMQATQRPQLPACQRVSRRRAVLCTRDRQRRGREINLGPLQIANLGGPQPVAECQQDHGRVAVRPAIALTAGNQLLDLAFGEVFACSDIGVFGPARRDFPFYGVW